MRTHKKQFRIIGFLCAVSLLLSAIHIPAFAVTACAVTATTNSVIKQGDSAGCYVKIDSTEGLAALDVAVHFDPEKVKITGVYNSVGCTLYDCVTNTDHIQFSYILDGVGVASETELFYFNYQVLSGAQTGDAYFDITIGEAYDSALNDVAVSGSRCKFTISETVTDRQCAVYSTHTVSTSIGQEFSLSYRFNTYQIASGSAVVRYDPDLFAVEAVKQEGFLAEKVVDINTDLTGAIYISFVGTEYVSNTNFVTVTFRTIKNVAETSQIQLKATDLCDKELNPIACNGYTTDVSVAFDPAYVGDAPEMALRGVYSYENRQITLTVSLEAGSRLGAGDFVIGFDPELVSYNSCEKGFSPSFFNINDKNAAAGELKFHIISLSDIVTEETVLTVVFNVDPTVTRATADFTLDGTGLTDSLTESIQLNFVDDGVWLEYLVQFCDEQGSVLQSALYHYGDPVTAPEAPAKAADNTYTYTFAGWDKAVTDCLGEATYTATYAPAYIDYEVVFLDRDGSELVRQQYHYGDTVIPPEDPASIIEAQQAFVFAGWDREVSACAGDAAYTAIYDAYHIGDVTCDGEINNADVVRLLWHTLFPGEYPVKWSMDLTKDTAVNNEDVVSLLWYMLFPEEYPLP